MEQSTRSFEYQEPFGEHVGRAQRARFRRGILDMGLIKFLLRKGWITQSEATSALTERSQTGGSLESVLLRHSMLTPQKVKEALDELSHSQSDLRQANFHWY